MAFRDTMRDQIHKFGWLRGALPVTLDASGALVEASTGNAVNVSVQGAATVQSFATGGSFTLAAAGSRTAALGDLSIYGIPFGSLTFTAAGSTDTIDITWACGNGRLVFEFASDGSTDALTVSAATVSSAGETISPVILQDLTDPANPVASIVAATTAGVYAVYLGG